MNALTKIVTLAALALTSSPAMAQGLPGFGQECDESLLFAPICEFRLIYDPGLQNFVLACECEVFYCNEDDEVDSYFQFADYEECEDNPWYPWW